MIAAANNVGTAFVAFTYGATELAVFRPETVARRVGAFFLFVCHE
jgi:hypothetical protein